MKLEKKDSIDFVFKTKDGKEVTACIPVAKIMKLGEEDAYECVTTPSCSESTCSVNNFCECNPINEDVELIRLEVSVG